MNAFKKTAPGLVWTPNIPRHDVQMGDFTRIRPKGRVRYQRATVIGIHLPLIQLMPRRGQPVAVRLVDLLEVWGYRPPGYRREPADVPFHEHACLFCGRVHRVTAFPSERNHGRWSEAPSCCGEPARHVRTVWAEPE